MLEIGFEHKAFSFTSKYALKLMLPERFGEWVGKNGETCLPAADCIFWGEWGFINRAGNSLLRERPFFVERLLIFNEILRDG